MMKFCENCGNQVSDNDTVCMSCGSSVTPTKVNSDTSDVFGGNESSYYSTGGNTNPPPTSGGYDNPSGYNNNYNNNQSGYNNNYNNPNEYNRQSQAPESSTLSICALIFSILGGWLGLVLGIVGVVKSKQSANRIRCIVAIVISIVWLIIEFTVIIPMYSQILGSIY